MTGKAPNTIDPVCGMAVSPETAAGMSRIGGTAFYFCSTGCNAKFDANPEAYVGGKGIEARPAACCGVSNGRSSCH